MINLLLLLPLILCFILFLFKNRILNRIVLFFHAIINFIISVSLCFNIDFLPMWKASRFFEINPLNKIFLMVLAIIYLAFAFYNRGYMKEDVTLTRKLRHYVYMTMLFILSMIGATLSTNLGITWVFLESATLTSAYLIYFYKNKHSIEAAWKYVFICSIGIALAFVGIILLTVATGNLNSLFYDDLYKNAMKFNPFWLKLSFVFIMFGIGTKMGLAPVHFWVPDAYAGAPAPISSLLSATLLNSAFLMILNVFKIMVIADCDGYAKLMMFTMGVLSLFVAAVFIYHINNYKRMLAYSSIENMGILIIATALGKAGIFAALIHVIGHSFIKAGFFMNAGNISKIYGTKKIKSITGLIKTDELTGWLWVLSFVAIVALPPSVLFMSEFLVIKSMLQGKYYILCILCLILMTIILYGISKAVITMTFGEKSNKIIPKKLPWMMYLPQIVLLLLTFTIGLYIPKCLIKTIILATTGF